MALGCELTQWHEKNPFYSKPFNDGVQDDRIRFATQATKSRNFSRSYCYTV